MAGSRWVKIDTSYLRNPKVTAVTSGARLLHLASILYTADQLTDGHIPARMLPELAGQAGLSRKTTGSRVAELVTRQLWVPNGDGWDIHDYQLMNPQAMRVAVEAERAAWRDRQTRHRHP
jgi:hypothetical protein